MKNKIIEQLKLFKCFSKDWIKSFEDLNIDFKTWINWLYLEYINDESRQFIIRLILNLNRELPTIDMSKFHTLSEENKRTVLKLFRTIIDEKEGI